MPFYLQVIIANFLFGALIWLEFFSLANSYNGLARRECQNFRGWFFYRVWGEQALLHGIAWSLQGAIIPILAIFVALPSVRFNRTLLMLGLVLGVAFGIRSFITEINKRKTNK